METTNIQVSERNKVTVRQFGLSVEDIATIAKQHNSKAKEKAFDDLGNSQLILKISIGLIEITLVSKPYSQKHNL